MNDKKEPDNHPITINNKDSNYFEKIEKDYVQRDKYEKVDNLHIINETNIIQINVPSSVPESKKRRKQVDLNQSSPASTLVEERTSSVRGLPVFRGDFIGRRNYLRSLQERIIQNGVIILKGAGGIGKSRLAYEVIKNQELEGCWIECININTYERLLTKICWILYRDKKLRDELDKKSDKLKFKALKDKLKYAKSVIVLDNFESLTKGNNVEDKIFNLISEIGEIASILITTRVLPEGLEEISILKNIPPLLDNEAIELFQERAGELSEKRKTIVEICQIIGNWPLAIELIAPKISMTHPDTLKRNISTSIKNIESNNPLKNSESERHRNIEACFQVSYQDLSKNAQLFLRRFSFLPNGINHDIIQIYKNNEIENWEEELVRASMWQLNQERYKVHPLIRAFAMDKAIESDYQQENRLEVARKLIELAAEKGRQTEPGVTSPEKRQEALIWIEKEWENLINCADYVASQDDKSTLTVLSDAVYDFCFTYGFSKECIELHEKALEFRKKKKDLSGLARTNRNLGLVFQRLPEWENAKKCFKNTVDFANACKDLSMKAKGLYSLGNAYCYNEQLELAVKLLKESCDLLEGISKEIPQELVHFGIAVGILAECYDRLGNNREAEKYYEKAISIKKKMKDQVGQGISCCQFGEFLLKTQKYERAEYYAELSRDIFIDKNNNQYKYGAISDSSAAYILLGKIYLKQNKIKEAEDELNKAIDLFDQAGIHFGESVNKGKALYFLAYCYLIREDKTKAKELLRESRKIFEECNDGNIDSLKQTFLAVNTLKLEDLISCIAF